MAGFKDKEDYYSYLRSLGGLPDGFRSFSTSLTFVPVERPGADPYRMNIAALLMDAPTDAFGAVFTRNSVCGAPVIIGRERLKRATMQGLLVNNRISNVAARGGVETAEAICAQAAELFGIEKEEIFPSSTGIIGWRLPQKEMLAAMPGLLPPADRAAPADPAEQLLSFAESIMTTDSYPKIRVKQLGRGRIVGVAKGAGMIEPNMATMLAFIMTDLDIEREELRRILGLAVDNSFNTISVDGDQSTSDMVLAFSSRQYSVKSDDFEFALRELCAELSRDIVRNGEGTAHVIQVDVGGHWDAGLCRKIGKAVGNSPLVKTALYGNDPNVGRILSAIGDQAGADVLDIDRLSIRIGEETVFRSGVFDLNKEREEALTEYLKVHSQNPRITGYPQNDRVVHIVIDLGGDAPFQRVFASDLGHEYVHENADYRS